MRIRKWFTLLKHTLKKKKNTTTKHRRVFPFHPAECGLRFFKNSLRSKVQGKRNNHGAILAWWKSAEGFEVRPRTHRKIQVGEYMEYM